jgi:hypothetical protein
VCARRPMLIFYWLSVSGPKVSMVGGCNSNSAAIAVRASEAFSCVCVWTRDCVLVVLAASPRCDCAFVGCVRWLRVLAVQLRDDRRWLRQRRRRLVSVRGFSPNALFWGEHRILRVSCAPRSVIFTERAVCPWRSGCARSTLPQTAAMRACVSTLVITVRPCVARQRSVEGPTTRPMDSACWQQVARTGRLCC